MGKGRLCQPFSPSFSSSSASVKAEGGIEPTRESEWGNRPTTRKYKHRIAQLNDRKMPQVSQVNDMTGHAEERLPDGKAVDSHK